MVRAGEGSPSVARDSNGLAREAREAASDRQVERLRQQFARFRRTHTSGTRYPQGLREAVLRALDGGASELELRRACGLSTAQLAAWRRRGLTAARGSTVAIQPARVFPVVDESPDASVEHAALHSGAEDIELRIGGWVVRIRRVEE